MPRTLRNRRLAAMSMSATPATPPTPLTPAQARTVPLEVLATFYTACKDAYYNTDTPLLSDDEFDAIERVFRKRAPQHPALHETGAAVDQTHVVSGRSVKLPYWMGSQDKMYPEDKTAFRRWRKRVPESHPCLASVKLDGLSAILVITATDAKLLSRGDGRMASDWTAHMQHMPHLQRPVRSVQQWLKTKGAASTPRVATVVVRGEAIMSHAAYNTHRESRKWTSTARNVVSGLLNAKESDTEALPWVDLLCYEVVEPHSWAPTAQLTWLDSHRFQTVSHSLGSASNASILPSNFGLADLEPLFWKYREQSPYATDGVVVVEDAAYKRNTTGNPKYGFAFKIRVDDASQVAETVVEEVEWNIARTGYLKPTVVLREVDIGGVHVRRATGYNYKFVVDNRIGHGARVQVRRCGDVIPNITAVRRAAPEPAYPPLGSFTLTDTGVDAVAKDPSAFGATNTYAAETLAFFFKTMQVPHISAKTAARFVEQGHTTPFQVAQVSAEEMASWDGFATKSSNQLHADIRHRLSTATALQWLIAGAVFGRGIGERKLVQLSQHAPGLFVPKQLSATEQAELTQTLLQVDGIQRKTAQQLLDRRELYLAYWKNVQTCVRQMGRGELAPLGAPAARGSRSGAAVSDATPPDLQGKVYCFTGFRDAALQAELQARGGVVEASMTAKVNVVVRKDASASGSKVRKAEAKGIPVVDLQHLRDSLR